MKPDEMHLVRSQPGLEPEIKQWTEGSYEKIIAAVCILALVLSFASCGIARKEGSSDNPADNSLAAETGEDIPDTKDTDGDVPGLQATDGNDSEKDAGDTENPEIPQVYKDFIKQLYPDTSDDVCFLATADMNLDV